MTLAVMLAFAPSAALADTILLKPELTALRMALLRLDNFDPDEVALFNRLSTRGRDLLIRERAAVVVTVADSGRWSYRVDGQTITSTHTFGAGDVRDAALVPELLQIKDVARLVNAQTPSGRYDSFPARKIAVEQKLRAIAEMEGIGIMDESMREEILANIGEELAGPDSSLAAALRLDPGVSSLAQEAQQLYAKKTTSRRELVAEFSAGGWPADLSPFAVRAGKLPEISDIRGGVSAYITNTPGQDPETTLFTVPGTSGTYYFRCQEKNVVKCMEELNAPDKPEVGQVVYLPDSAFLNFRPDRNEEEL